MRFSSGIPCRTAAVSFAVAALLLAASSAVAEFDAAQRPIQEFVEAQGTFCIDDGAGGCFLFVPPVLNFFGFSAPAQGRFASVDYAGLANRKLIELGGTSLGTRTEGTVLERPLADGRAEVHVTLHTRNALSWAIAANPDGSFDFATGTLLFGHRMPEVRDGARPALGDALMEVVFVNTAPGAPLPDLLQLFSAPLEGQEARFISFFAHATGPLREAFGVNDGTRGRMEVTQTGLLMTPFMGAVGDAFPAERVDLHRTSGRGR